MTRLIKKYKNRRLYDTETSQYITLDDLQKYILAGEEFKVEDSQTKKDLTNTILLQILVEMEAGPTQFLSSEILRHIILLANHPMHLSFKEMTEQMFQTMNKPLQTKAYEEVTSQWNKQMQNMLQKWQKIFE